ncbi:MAG: hypothetical protein JWR62_3032 [Modestobacter sp.]|nr:hypothetical protein [Modestobacter sp.]HEV7871029.1 hypothetical protein [Modestobacter sp.]
MTQPHPPRPLPGPPRSAAPSPEAPAVPAADVFAGLTDRPVAEHVAVFEAEHDRLRRELSTIDQL